ncbi:hypothetical protein DV735_g165, partial [Chaetothyriales sp. CBS 134920]
MIHVIVMTQDNNTIATAITTSWASVSDTEYSHDDDLQSEVTDAGSLIDLQSTADDQSLMDDTPSQHDFVDHQTHLDRPDLRSSTQSMTPAASRFIDPSLQPAEIAFDESDESYPGSQHVHAIHTLTTFNTNEAARLQLPSSTKSSYLGTLHISLSKTPLRHHNRTSFRLLLLGLEYTASLRTCLVNKIADALVASHEEDQAYGPPSRYHVVPDSFGPGSQPAAAEVIPIAQTLDVETFHTAIASGDRDGKILLCNEHTMERAVSSFDKRRGRYVVLTDGWQQPDLAIVVIDSRDSAEARASASSLFTFAKRLSIPAIVLRMDNDWNADLVPLTLAHPDVRLCIEDGSRSPAHVVRTLPLDLNTFLNVNPAQLGRHIAYLLSAKHGPAGITSLESPDSPASDQLDQTEAYAAKAKSTLKETYARLQHAAPPGLVQIVAALAATILVLQCAALILKPNWAATSPPLTPGLALDAHPVSSTRSTPSSDLVPILGSTVSAALAATTRPSSRRMLEAGRFGNTHILLRISERLSSSHAASIKVYRNHEPVRIETQALFPGLFSIHVDPYQAYGNLSVCLNMSTAQRQECTTVDFEEHALASWLKQQIGALRVSLDQLTDSDRPREVIKEAQKRVLALEKTALRDLESWWAVISAWKSGFDTYLHHMGDRAGRNVRHAGRNSHAAMEAAYRGLGSGRRMLATSQLKAKRIVNRLGKMLRQDD